MRAIIIEDKDSLALLDQLKLEEFTCKPFGSSTRHVMEKNNLTEDDLQWLIKDIHSRFHYRVCRWLQDQGCNTVR